MVQPVSDDQLATEGMQLRNQGRVLLIACGALAREILAVMKTNDWQHMDLQCLPAIYHNTPDKITPAVKNYIEKYRDDYSQIFVVYADCGTGGHLQNLCDEMGVSMISGPHCYSFFEGNAAFEAQEELTCFYLTDFLVKNFKRLIIDGLGISKHPSLKDEYFKNYKNIVYLAQKHDNDLELKAKDCANYLNLEYSVHYTGLGNFEDQLNKAMK